MQARLTTCKNQQNLANVRIYACFIKGILIFCSYRSCISRISCSMMTIMQQFLLNNGGIVNGKGRSCGYCKQ